jgi:hypothetical protein
MRAILTKLHHHGAHQNTAFAVIVRKKIKNQK